MRVFIFALLISLLVQTSALSQGQYPSEGNLPTGGSPGQVVTNIAPGRGNWQDPSGGGGSGPFPPAGVTAISTLSNWRDLCISHDGVYIYVAGQLASNSHLAVVKVKVSDGTVVATCEINNTTTAGSISVSPDGAAVYCVEEGGSPTHWYKIATAGMTLVHDSTLAVDYAAQAENTFDLSPDGTIWAYVSNVDAKLYMIDTATYVVTNQTMSHTAGNLSAVCFYNGSNTNVYVSHTGSADIDLYAIGGAYTSTISTGAGGTPNFVAMRSGINDSLFILDNGTNDALISVFNGTPHIGLVSTQVGWLAVNTLSPIATDLGQDVCVAQAYGLLSPFYLSESFEYNPSPVPLPVPFSFNGQGAYGCALAPDSSGRVFTLSGTNYAELWSFVAQSAGPSPFTAGNLMTSDGKGNWVSDDDINIGGFLSSQSITIFESGGSLTLTETGGSEQMSMDAVAQTGSATMHVPNMLGVTSYIESAPTNTTVAGSASGNLYWQEAASPNYKKVVVVLDAYNNGASTTTITFSTPFAHTPGVTGNTTGLVISAVSTTQATIAISAGISGTIVIEGF